MTVYHYVQYVYVSASEFTLNLFNNERLDICTFWTDYHRPIFNLATHQLVHFFGFKSLQFISTRLDLGSYLYGPI